MDYNSTLLLHAAGIVALVLMAKQSNFFSTEKSGAPVKARPGRGDTVVCFDCRGCTAEEHQLDWIGIVTGYSDNRFASESVVCDVKKRGTHHSDSRDGVLGVEKPVWDQGPFQKVGPNLYFLFK